MESDRLPVDEQIEEFLAVTKRRKMKQIWSNDDLATTEATKKSDKKGEQKNKSVRKTDEMKKVEDGSLVEEKLVQSKRRGGEGVFLKKLHVKFQDSDDDIEVNRENDGGEGEGGEAEKPKKRIRKRKVGKKLLGEEEVASSEEKKSVFSAEVSDLDYLKSRMTLNEDDLIESEGEEEEEEGKGEREEGEEVEEGEREVVEIEYGEGEGEEEKKEKREEEKTKKRKDSIGNQLEAEIEEEEEDNDEESGRVLLHNLPYEATIEEVYDFCRKYGEIADVDIPIEKDTKKPRGFAFIQYLSPASALLAVEKLDGNIFQGRILAAAPAKRKKRRATKESFNPLGRQSSFQQQREEEKKERSMTEEHTWNSLFLRSDAVADAVSQKYNISKGDRLSLPLDFNFLLIVLYQVNSWTPLPPHFQSGWRWRRHKLSLIRRLSLKKKG